MQELWCSPWTWVNTWVQVCILLHPGFLIIPHSLIMKFSEWRQGECCKNCEHPCWCCWVRIHWEQKYLGGILRPDCGGPALTNWGSSGCACEVLALPQSTVQGSVFLWWLLSSRLLSDSRNWCCQVVTGVKLLWVCSLELLCGGRWAQRCWALQRSQLISAPASCSVCQAYNRLGHSRPVNSPRPRGTHARRLIFSFPFPMNITSSRCIWMPLHGLHKLFEFWTDVCVQVEVSFAHLCPVLQSWTSRCAAWFHTCASSGTNWWGLRVLSCPGLWNLARARAACVGPCHRTTAVDIPTSSQIPTRTYATYTHVSYRESVRWDFQWRTDASKEVSASVPFSLWNSSSVHI